MLAVPNEPSSTMSASQVVGARLKWVRGPQGLPNRVSQQDLSDATNGEISRRTIQKIEAGEQAVTVDQLLLLAAALCVSPALLLTPPPETAVQVGSQKLWGEATPRSVAAWIVGDAPLQDVGLGSWQSYFDLATDYGKERRMDMERRLLAGGVGSPPMRTTLVLDTEEAEQ